MTAEEKRISEAKIKEILATEHYFAEDDLALIQMCIRDRCKYYHRHE